MRVSRRATVLLPLPLAPTSAVTRPGRREKLTSSTARSVSALRRPAGPDREVPAEAVRFEDGRGAIVALTTPLPGSGRRRAGRPRSGAAAGRRRRSVPAAIGAARVERAARRRVAQVRRRPGDARSSPSARRSAAGTSSSAPRCRDGAASGAAPRRARARRCRRAYMIAIRSLSSTRSERSCVMKSTANPSSRCSSLIWSRISRWTTTSSAVVGSSMRSSSGLERERHRDDHALPHAARELVRVRPQRGPGRCRRARAGRPRARAPPSSDPLVRLEHVDELVADARDRVERVHRALEDERDVPPAEPAQVLAACRPSSSSPLKRMLPPATWPGRPQDLHDRVRDRALAAARLARQADDLAGMDRERDPVDGAARILSPAVLDDEAVDLDERRLSSSRSRRRDLGGQPRSRRTLLGRKSRVKRPGRGGFVSRSRGSPSSSMP